MGNEREMPVGFAFQMSMNEKAMENFSKMTDAEKYQVLEAARSVNSKEEVRGLVDDLRKMS